jgi:hypothetical protein
MDMFAKRKQPDTTDAGSGTPRVTQGQQAGFSPEDSLKPSSSEQAPAVATLRTAPGHTTGDGVKSERERLQERYDHLTKSVNNLEKHIVHKELRIRHPSWLLMRAMAADVAKVCDAVGLGLSALGASHVVSTFLSEGRHLNPWLTAAVFAPLVTEVIKVLGPYWVVRQERELKSARELLRHQHESRSVVGFALRKYD